MDESLEFYLLVKKITRDRGLSLAQYKDAYIKRRLQARMRAAHIDGYAAYSKALTSDPDEYRKLLDALTINVTRFFRDRTVFEILERQIIPDILVAKRERRQSMLRVWSAGCSTGEEPYSIGMLLCEALGFRMRSYIVSVLATDYDQNALAVAKKGEYDAAALERVPKELVERYFKDGDAYRVRDDLRAIIKFKQADLFADIGARYMDVVFCRNVMIYFTRQQQERLFDIFHEALNEGGYLVIGKTETIPGTVQKKFVIVNGRERIFRRS